MRLALFALAAQIVLAGCSLVEGEPAQVAFRATLPAAPAAVEVDAALGGRAVALTEQAEAGQRSLYTEPVEASARPTVAGCTVSNGTAATHGEVELDLRSNWWYSVECVVASKNPAEACFGCQGAAAFALDPALGLPVGDSLFVTWGGYDIDNPVVY